MRVRGIRSSCMCACCEVGLSHVRETGRGEHLTISAEHVHGANVHV